MNDEQRELMDAQGDQQLRSTAQSVGMQVAADAKQHTIHNENFLNELRSAGLDDDVDGSYLEEEFSHWFADARAISNRGDEWDIQADLLMLNKRERALAERRPGRLLRDRPFLMATMQGADTPQLDAYAAGDIPGSRQFWHDRIIDQEQAKRPATSKEQSKLYGAAEVAADLMALSRNAAGLESVSTVKTETNVRRQEEEESTKEKVGRMME